MSRYKILFHIIICFFIILLLLLLFCFVKTHCHSGNITIWLECYQMAIQKIEYGDQRKVPS